MLSGGARFDDGAGGDNEVQRTMLEIVNQLDGFDARGNVKVGRKHSSQWQCG
jgi:26S proteasome regulatory subunit T1